MLNVRCWRSKQTPMLECGNAGFDPQRTSGGVRSCIAQVVELRYAAKPYRLMVVAR
jgi:hypothetical protein